MRVDHTRALLLYPHANSYLVFKGDFFALSFDGVGPTSFKFDRRKRHLVPKRKPANRDG